MKASDFRLGNYTNGGVVISVHSDRIYCYGHYNMSGMTSFEESEINPTPLTEEWLVKFGFEEYGEGWHNGLIWYVNNKCWFGKSQIIENVKSVHQLQNLYFALTNEELTIKA